MINRSLFLFLFSAICLLPLIACITPNPEEELREQQLKNSEINQINISAARNTLLDGQRTRLQAIAMIGNSPQDVTQNTSFHVEGPGDIERKDGKAYYVATSTTINEDSIVYGVLDPSSIGSSGKTVQSNRLNMFVLSREKYEVSMPSEDSFETRKATPSN